MLPEMEGKNVLPAVRCTHIHDLTEDCLVTVLSLVGNQDEDLPIKQTVYHDTIILHPLQCALVCKRWQACAPAPVHSLQPTWRCNADKLMKQAGRFTGLRQLRLFEDSCFGFSLAQVAAAFPALQRLEINLSSRQWDGSDLIYWTQLTELDICCWHSPTFQESCKTLLNVLPRMSSVESLRLDFPAAAPPDGIWEMLWPRMTQLRKLGLPGIPPTSSATVPSLDLPSVTSLPDHLLPFRNIRWLRLLHTQVTELPAQLGSIKSLEALSLWEVPLLTTMPNSLGSLSGLTSLNFTFCEGLTSLPASIGSLHTLKVLKMLQCGLEVLPDSLGQLASLEELQLGILELLRVVPESIGSLGRLQKLTLGDLPLVTYLPESLGQLTGIKDLSLRRLVALQALPVSIGKLGRLQKMELNGLTSIGFLPDSIGQLTGLVSLVMRYLTIANLPDSMSNLSNLCELWIGVCARITELPLGVTNLSNLRQLAINKCDEFSDEKNVISRMSSLRYLRIAGCPHQTRLPVGLETLLSLKLIKCSRDLMESASRELIRMIEEDCDGTVFEWGDEAEFNEEDDGEDEDEVDSSEDDEEDEVEVDSSESDGEEGNDVEDGDDGEED